MLTRSSSRVIAHRHPQPEDLGAALLDHVLRRDDVAERLRHLAAFEVDQEAVRQHLADTAAGRASPAPPAASSGTSRDAGRCPRGTCPTARSGRRSAAAPPRGSSRSRTRRRGCRARARTTCRRTTGTSARPAGTPRSAARTRRRRCTARTRAAAWSISSRVRTASPQAVQSTAGIGTPQARWREMHQSGRFVTMLKMRSRPQRRDPFHLMVDGVPRRLAQRPRLAVVAGDDRLAVQAHEPLRRGQEDHRVVAAPAVRVLVRERLPVPEPAALVQRLLDLRVGVEHALAAEQLHRVEEVAAGSDRRVDLEAVLHAGQEVVRAVAGAVCTAPVPCSSVT